MIEFLKPKSDKWDEEIKHRHATWKEELKNITGLTRDDLQGISVDHSVIKEALRQVELIINHQNQKKERIDQRVYNLLPIFTSTVTAMFGAIFYLLQNINIRGILEGGVFVLLILCFTLFCFLCTKNLLQTLKPYKYCDIGKEPSFWIDKSILEGETNALVYIIYDYYSCFKEADESNKKRLKLLYISIQYYCICIGNFGIILVISSFKQLGTIF